MPFKNILLFSHKLFIRCFQVRQALLKGLIRILTQKMKCFDKFQCLQLHITIAKSFSCPASALFLLSRTWSPFSCALISSIPLGICLSRLFRSRMLTNYHEFMCLLSLSALSLSLPSLESLCGPLWHLELIQIQSDSMSCKEKRSAPVIS